MNSTEQLLVTQHNLYNRMECLRVRNRVLALRSFWRPRSGAQFFTLGTASYMDALAGQQAYLEAAHATNSLMSALFRDVYRDLRLFFEELLGNRVLFNVKYALPGFHIFPLYGVESKADDPGPRAHFDLQWMHANPGLVPEQTLSFTLPIEEPSGGASIEFWHLRYNDAVQLGISGRDYAASHGSRKVRYSRGRILVTDGLDLHAIGASTIDAKGYRITLQGHGMLGAEGWILYW